MPSQKNKEAVQALKERLARSTIIISTGYTGLDGVAMTSLRRALRAKGLEYRVVKNTVTAIAGQEAGLPEVEQVLQGPTGLVLASGDAVEAAQALNDYLRTTRLSLTVRGAVLGGRVLSPADLTALANLPPRRVLAGQVAGSLVGLLTALVSRLNAPAQRLVSALNSPAQGLVTVIQRRVEQQTAV
jgi:large subunit ribosomal protein L10